MEDLATKVRINGFSQDLGLPDDTPFIDVMQKVNEMVKSPGIAIMSVKLNGEDITGKSWDDYAGLKAGEISDIQIETGNTNQLAHQMLESLNAFISDLITELKKASELFRLGKEAEGGDSFMRIADAITLINHTSLMIERNLGRESNNGDSGVSQINSLEPIVADMVNAQQNSDWVLLADLVEYELIPHFEKRLKILQSWQ